MSAGIRLKGAIPASSGLTDLPCVLRSYLAVPGNEMLYKINLVSFTRIEAIYE